jgi:hypothetical protein
MNTVTEQQIEFTRVNNDVNGNPRYVCQFHALLTNDEFFMMPIDDSYKLALKRAKQLGGRKFHNKQYGGGILFRNIYNLNTKINELLNTI